MKRVKVRPRNNLSLSSVGGTFDQGPFWTHTGGPLEGIGDDFESYTDKAFKGNSVVFTTMLIRSLVLSEARFQYQRLEQGRPTDLWGDPSLRLLEQPWPNGTTGELISRMDQDFSLAGNFFAARIRARNGERLRRMRPDWVTIVTLIPDEDGSPWDLNAEVGGYLYRIPGREPVMLPVDQVVHWSPIPDPTAQWRGQSWITAVADEVAADNATTKHKQKYFQNGATSNLIISYDPAIGVDTMRDHAEFFKEQYGGVDKAYKTIHLGGGADPKTVGADMKQLDFKVTQGAGESRIAAASLVGAVVAQLSEGMQGSSLNAGNFGVAMRRFADIAARPLWRTMAASLQTVVNVPGGSRLWYDDRDIPFLQDDAKDHADILFTNSQAIAALTRDGFDAESAVSAITSGDLRRLEHTGLPSVQVQPAEQPATNDGDD